uniref:Uncharacterized protein n=1 Tax=Macaca fascicularis TaxID=9541 RepID=Q9BE03_MACFA|nr:hypothetical protein [Macaca fascicularis]
MATKPKRLRFGKCSGGWGCSGKGGFPFLGAQRDFCLWSLYAPGFPADMPGSDVPQGPSDSQILQGLCASEGPSTSVLPTSAEGPSTFVPPTISEASSASGQPTVSEGPGTSLLATPSEGLSTSGPPTISKGLARRGLRASGLMYWGMGAGTYCIWYLCSSYIYVFSYLVLVWCLEVFQLF